MYSMYKWAYLWAQGIPVTEENRDKIFDLAITRT